MSGNSGLHQRQRLAIILLAVGTSQRETADTVGVCEDTIRRWKQEQTFAALLEKKKAEIEGKVETAKEILIEAAPLAAFKQIDCLGSSDESIALRSSGEILDRVGIGKTSKVEQITDSIIKLTWEDGGDNDNQAIPPPGATGDPPEQGEIQSGGGGQEVREDQAGSD